MSQVRPIWSVAEINQLTCDAFVATLGYLFEHTPMIAERTWHDRPFSSCSELHQALMRTMYALSPAQQVDLISAHPDLAGRAAIAGNLTAESAREQRSVRLDQLSTNEYARFQALNQAYRAKFGFPFIICVREHTLASILTNFERRIALSEADEITTALGEIAKIAGLRLADTVAD